MKYLILIFFLASCQSKFVTRKAVYTHGKIIAVGKYTPIKLNEGDTINLIKKVR